MTTPEPRVPWYIDASARHRARTMRMLAYMALAGREGVLNPMDCRVRALDTPGASIRVDPGAWGVLNRAIGGAYEAYVDKFTQEIVKGVPATSATGRTDLVILRVLNPYVAESGGSVPIPADAEEGPYWDIQVITGVTPNINSVVAFNSAYSAITLARITRPASTGIITQAHITDLRSLVDLSGERLIIIDSPPAAAPPIAQDEYTESTPVGNNTELRGAVDTTYVQFPGGVSWPVPVPSWAVGVDVFVAMQPAMTSGDFIGELRPRFSGVTPTIVPSGVNENLDGRIRMRPTLLVGGTQLLPASVRGKLVTFTIEGRSLNSALAGKLIMQPGTRIYVNLTFKKYPVVTDGA